MTKPCKYCNLAVGEMKSIASERSIRPLNILHETPKRWRLVSTNNPRLTESVLIYSCPRCGRNLTEKKQVNPWKTCKQKAEELKETD